MQRRWVAWVGLAAIVLLFAVAAWFRVAQLGTVPGINGDEAWYGVQAANLVGGRPVTWRTPTGLPVNPFFTGLEVPLLARSPAAFWMLRFPAALSGLLAVALMYGLGARALDRTTALIAAILLATSPIAIGYARFGWDASQTPLFSLIALCLALRGRIVATAVAFVVCLVVHPSNVFLFPALLFPLVVVAWNQGRRRELKRLFGVAAAGGVLALAAGGLVYALTGPGEAPGEVVSRLLSRLPVGSKVPATAAWLVGAVMKVLARLPIAGAPSETIMRLLDGPALATLLGNWGRLLSGITIYEYVVGPVPPLVARLHDWAFWVAVVVLLDLGLRRLRARRQWDRLALALGLAASAFAIYFVAGPDSFGPHSERYGIFLVVPTLVVLACLVRGLMPEGEAIAAPGADPGAGSRTGPDPATARWLGGVTAVGWLFLLLFHLNYFAPIRRTGGESHPTFRTARVEPKQQALDLILGELSRGGGPARGRIVAEDWWTFRPIEFLASSHPGVLVESGKGDRIEPKQPDVAERTEYLRRAVLDGLRDGAYVVGFVGARAETMIRAEPPAGTLRRWTIADRGGRDLIVVYHLDGAAPAPPPPPTPDPAAAAAR
jgi:hypothetical protein